jgi:hypothetical protein
MCSMRRFLAVLSSFFLSSLSYTFSCHSSPPTILPSSLTSSYHLFLGLSLGLVSKFIHNTLLGIIFYSISCIQWNLGSRTPLITNKFSEKKKSRVTNDVSSNEHASRQQRLTTSWVYRRESVSCCVTFAQYT